MLINRFLLVGLIWLACVGGVAAYMDYRDARRLPANFQPAAPEGEAASVRLVLTLTFGAVPDPFALDAGGDSSPVGLQLNGAALEEAPQDLPPGTPWLLEDIAAVAGANELLLRAAPPVGDASHAARVQIFQGSALLADRTFWSQGGEAIVGTVRFTPAGDIQ